MITELRISRAEFASRRSRLLALIQEHGLAGVVLFDYTNILYFTGFAFIPTERPIAFVLSADGEPGMFVPRLEVEHARGETGFERIGYYPEYPGEPHPMIGFSALLDEMGMKIGAALGADMNGYPLIFGYQGPALSDLTGSRVNSLQPALDRMQAVKSEAELDRKSVV